MPLDLHQTRIQRVALGEILEVGKFDAGIKVVGAGFENVLAGTRAFGGNQRLKVDAEQGRPQLLDFFFVGRVRKTASAMMQGRETRRAQLLERKFGKKLLRGGFVMVSPIGPEEFGKSENLGVDGAIGSFGVRDDQLQHALLPQSKSRELIVDDGVDGYGRLR